MRKRAAKKRPLLPDPRFNDQLVTRFVNNLMWDGKKSVAFKVFYDAIAIVEEKNQKVLGCHFVSPFAGELIQLVAVAITMGATKLDFDKTIAVHPTISEELVTMRKPTRRT